MYFDDVSIVPADAGGEEPYSYVELNPEKAARIAAYFLSHPFQGLTSAREALGNEVSYGDLRYVLKDLERQGKYDKWEK